MSAPNEQPHILDRRAVLAALRARANTPEQLERLGGNSAMSLASELGASTDQGERELGRALMLARVSQVVNSSLDLEIVLRSVLDLAVEFMNAQRGFLMLRNERTGALEISVMHNFDRETLESDDQKISNSIVNRVLESREPILTSDAQEDPRFNAQHSIMALHIRSIVCAPLIVKGRTIGVCYLDSRVMPGLFTRQDPELLFSLANQAALAIENARLFNDQQARLREISRLEAFQTRVLDSIASGVITLDSGRTITSFNDAAAQTFGLLPTTMVGRPVSALETYLPGIGALVDAGDIRNDRRNEMRGEHAGRSVLSLEVRLAQLDLGDDRRGIAIAIDDLTEQRTLERLHADEVADRERIAASFSRYLAPHVVESLMQASQSVELGGDRQEATILFADIRGFTALASRLQAERVVEFLNTYFDEAVRVVFAHEGLLDKFYGDGLMAVFGPPLARSDDATRAVRASLALHEAVRRLAPKLAHPLAISIGLASGSVVAGHIGSTRRMDYTVIGDAVNLASRLQAAAPVGGIFIDEETYRRSLLRPPAEQMQAKVKGRDDMVTLYSVTAP